MALYLTLGQNGGIWNGKPNTVTNTNDLVKESSGVSEALYEAASNAPIPTTDVTFTASSYSGSGTTGVFRYVTEQVGGGSETVVSGTNQVATLAGVGWFITGTGVTNGRITSKTSTLVSTSTAGSTVTRTYAVTFVVSAGSFSSSASYQFVPTFKVVVVGTAGSILLSYRDGDATGTWTKVKQASSGLEGVAYGNGNWVAVGQNNLVLTSTDGNTWTESRGAFPGAQWNWIAYGNGKFVAVGSGTVNGASVGAVMFSTNGGASWTRGNSGTTNHLQSVAYSPTLNVFVAVGNNGAIVTVNG
jgi:hypothetical protein